MPLMPSKPSKSLNVLVLGGGAREHAIVCAVKKSPLLNKLFLADANDGFSNLGRVLKYKNFEDLALKAKKNNVDLLIVGGEEPLCEGIVDVFQKHGIKSIGVNKKFSRLESSKLFAKDFMKKYGIKTAKVLRGLENPPYVIKEDGLKKGKGVVVVEDLKTAKEAILKGEKVFIEEFLSGEELSLMSLFDGKNLLNFLPARDFKRLNNDKNSPNTGGMGSFCPVKLTSEQKKALEKYTLKLKNALIAENADFKGFIYSALVWHVEKGVGNFWVLEYNVRLGDPEAQSILPHLKTDFLTVLNAAIEGKLNEINLEYKSETTATLVIASEGYPICPVKGEKIENLSEEVEIYFAGVKKTKDGLYSNGGRVLSLTTNAKEPFEILKKAAKEIKMEGKIYREDLCL